MRPGAEWTSRLTARENSQGLSHSLTPALGAFTHVHWSVITPPGTVRRESHTNDTVHYIYNAKLHGAWRTATLPTAPSTQARCDTLARPVSSKRPERKLIRWLPPVPTKVLRTSTGDSVPALLEAADLLEGMRASDGEAGRAGALGAAEG